MKGPKINLYDTSITEKLLYHATRVPLKKRIDPNQNPLYPLLLLEDPAKWAPSQSQEITEDAVWTSWFYLLTPAGIARALQGVLRELQRVVDPGKDVRHLVRATCQLLPRWGEDQEALQIASLAIAGWKINIGRPIDDALLSVATAMLSIQQQQYIVSGGVQTQVWMGVSSMVANLTLAVRNLWKTYRVMGHWTYLRNPGLSNDDNQDQEHAQWRKFLARQRAKQMACFERVFWKEYEAVSMKKVTT